MSRQRIKTFFSRMAEVLVALSLVLLAFYAITLLVNSLFPSGSGLVGNATEATGGARVGGQELLISARDYEAGLTDLAGLAAVLDDTQNTVKRKPSDGIAWTKVVSGTPLFDRDAVQTFKGSSAEIIFDKSNHLVMEENSLVIIQSMDKDVFLNERRSQVVVVDGELSGTISSIGKEGLKVEVTTPGAIARIKSGNEDAKFSVKVNPDKSSTLTVFSGQAELVSMGQSRVIKANQSVTADMGAAPKKAISLPGKIRLIQPQHRSNVEYRDLPPQLKFEWSTLKNATAYHVQLSVDEEFEQLVVDEIVEVAEFVYGNLRNEKYFWRARAIKGWVKGPYTDAHVLSVKQDRQPPLLEVIFPPRFSDQPLITLTGRSDVNAVVVIEGNEIGLNENGNFSYDVQLQQGVNILVVEAIDGVGNVTYKSGVVYGKF